MYHANNDNTWLSLDKKLVDTTSIKIKDLTQQLWDQRVNELIAFFNNNDFKPEIKKSIELLLKNIVDSNSTDMVLGYLSELYEIIDIYQLTKEDITTRTRAILPTEFLNDWDSISNMISGTTKDRIKDADNLKIDQLTEKINSLVLSGNVTKADFDTYFDWIRKNILGAFLNEFEKSVAEFKQSELYKDWLNLSEINKELDSEKDKINSLEEWDEITVDFQWVEYVFYNKEDALRLIYKIKLILWEPDSHLSIAPSLKKEANKMWVLWFVMFIWKVYVLASILESMHRNFSDFMAVKVWSRWYSKYAVWIAEFFWNMRFKDIRGFDKTSLIKRVVNIPWWTWQKFFQLIWGAFSAWEKAYMDPNLSNVLKRVTIFDTTALQTHQSQNLPEKDRWSFEEMITKAQVMDYMKKRFSWDTDIMNRLKSLENSHDFFFWWELNSSTNTFWIKIYEILHNTKWPVWILKSARNFDLKDAWMSTLKQWWEILTIWGDSFKTSVINIINEDKKNRIDILNDFYEDREKNLEADWKIKDGVFHWLWKAIVDGFSLDPRVDDADELARKEAIIKHLKDIEEFKNTWTLNRDDIIRSIINISEWKPETDPLVSNKEQMVMDYYNSIKDKSVRIFAPELCKEDNPEIKEEAKIGKLLYKLNNWWATSSIDSVLSELYQKVRLEGANKLEWTTDHFNYILDQIFEWKSLKDATTKIADGDLATKITPESRNDRFNKLIGNFDVEINKNLSNISAETDIVKKELALKEFKNTYLSNLDNLSNDRLKDLVVKINYEVDKIEVSIFEWKVIAINSETDIKKKAELVTELKAELDVKSKSPKTSEDLKIKVSKMISDLDKTDEKLKKFLEFKDGEEIPNEVKNLIETARKYAAVENNSQKEVLLIDTLIQKLKIDNKAITISELNNAVIRIYSWETKLTDLNTPNWNELLKETTVNEYIWFDFDKLLKASHSDVLWWNSRLNQLDWTSVDISNIVTYSENGELRDFVIRWNEYIEKLKKKQTEKEDIEKDIKNKNSEEKKLKLEKSQKQSQISSLDIQINDLNDNIQKETDAKKVNYLEKERNARVSEKSKINWEISQIETKISFIPDELTELWTKLIDIDAKIKQMEDVDFIKLRDMLPENIKKLPELNKPNMKFSEFWKEVGTGIRKWRI